MFNLKNFDLSFLSFFTYLVSKNKLYTYIKINYIYINKLYIYIYLNIVLTLKRQTFL